MRILFIADEVSKLKVKSDTSLAMAEEFLKKNQQVFWSTPSDLRLSLNELFITTEKLKYDGNNFSLNSKTEETIQSFDWILIRKDPPFDEKYIELCWLLAPYESKIKFINKPSLLLRYHEKMIPFECLKEKVFSADEILPMTFVRNLDELNLEIKKTPEKEWVLKPFFGHGGEEIHLFQRDNLSGISKIFNGHNWILQPLVSEVRDDGDYRALFIDGEFVGGVLRRPAKGSIVSNFAQGGSAVPRTLSELELNLLKRLGGWLKEKGFFFAGADLIGGKLSEVNVTSPTGFRAVFQIDKISLAEKFFSQMEKL